MQAVRRKGRRSVTRWLGRVWTSIKDAFALPADEPLAMRLRGVQQLEDRCLLSATSVGRLRINDNLKALEQAFLEKPPVVALPMTGDLAQAWLGRQPGNHTTTTNTSFTQSQKSMDVLSPAKSEAAAPRREVVFLDTSVQDYQQLAKDVLTRQDPALKLDVVYLDPTANGIDQITQALANYENLDAVHIISHGSDGAVKLASQWLDVQALQTYESDVRAWGAALKPGADILLYGCNVAQTQAGQQLVRNLGALTGADVAASINPTGHTSLAGDWQLEFQAGAIDESTPFSAAFGERWIGLLAVNEAPVNSVPGPQLTQTDTSLTFSSANGNLISTSDPDAGINPVEITLTATNGTITLAWPSGAATATGGEFRVNSVTSDRQATLDGEFYGATTNDFGGPRAVASDPSGNFVVTWSSKNQDGDGWGIYAQRYDAAGVALGGPFLVNTTTSKDQVHSSVAMDDAGNFVIVWASKDQDGNNWGIFAQRYNSAGVAQGSEFQVNTYTNKEQLGAGVGMDRAGNFVITWSSKDQDGNNWGVYAKRFNAAGAAQGGEFRVNTATAKEQTASSVAMDSDGNFVVTWSSKDQDGDNWSIYAKRYDAGGLPQGAEFLVNTTAAKEQEFSSVAMDAHGNFVVAWSSKDQDGDNWGVYAQRYNAAGMAQGSEFQVNLTTAKEQMHSSVAMDADGDFVITWTSKDQDGNGRGIYAREYNAAGVAKGGETMVNTTTSGDQEYSSVAMDAKGNFMVVWTGNGPGDSLGVFGQRFTVPTTLTFISGDGTRDTTMTFRGTLAEVNAALDGLVFAPNLGFNGLATVTITTNDLGNVGTGGPQSDSDTIDINVGTGNVAPTVTLSGGALNYTENDPATVIDGVAMVSDPDSADLDGGELTVFFSAGGTDDDRLAIRNQGAGAGQIGVSGGSVTYGGIVIGSFTGGGDAVTPLVVTLNANATPAAVEALARNITYQNVSENPSTLVRTAQFALTDGDGGKSNIAAENIVVTAVNDAPVAGNDSYSVSEDATLNVAAPGVLVNDVDADGDPIQAVLVSGPSNAAVFTLNADGSFSYTPNLNFNGTDSFTYRADDGMAQSGLATVTITVNAVNDAPVAANDNYALNEDGTLNVVAASVLGNDSDIEGNPLTAVLVSGPGNGALTLNADGSFSYTPNADFSGTDSFTYRANDGAANSNLATVSITVTAVNDAPVRTAGTINNLIVLEDSGTTSLGLSTLLYGPGGGADEVGQLLTFTVTVVPVATLGDIVLADGVTVVTASTSYTLVELQGMQFRTADDANGGPATFSWTVQDNGGAANGGVDTLAESLTITVTAVNDAPVRTGGAVNNLIVLEDSGTTSLGLGSVAYGPGGGADEASQAFTFTVTAVPAATLGDIVLADGVTVVTASTSYTLAQLQGMQFRAAADANGGPATFSWIVQDSGGTANGGADTLGEALAITVIPAPPPIVPEVPLPIPPPAPPILPPQSPPTPSLAPPPATFDSPRDSTASSDTGQTGRSPMVAAAVDSGTHGASASSSSSSGQPATSGGEAPRASVVLLSGSQATSRDDVASARNEVYVPPPPEFDPFGVTETARTDRAQQRSLRFESSADFGWTALDDMEESANFQETSEPLGVVVATGLLATAGFFLVNTRAGLWLLSLMAARPLWKQFDPLEILYAWDDEAAEYEEARGETLASLVD